MLQRQSSQAETEEPQGGSQAKKLKPSPAVARPVPRSQRAPIPDDVISDVGALSALAGQDRAFLDPSQMPGRSHKRLLPGETFDPSPLPSCLHLKFCLFLFLGAVTTYERCRHCFWEC